METAIIILSAILLGMIAAVVCLFVAIIKAEKRIATLEEKTEKNYAEFSKRSKEIMSIFDNHDKAISVLFDRNHLQEQFYKKRQKRIMQVFRSVICHCGNRNTYNNAL